MAYNDVINRQGAQALMPEEVSREILGNVAAESIVMSMARKLPNMSRKQSRMPVWSSLPNAYFVNGDTGLKQTTAAAWENKYINAEELAVIVPVPDSVRDDADYDIFGEIRPAIESAIGAAVDRAILFGINAPASWPECIVEGAEAAGHEVTIGEVGDLYSDIFGVNGVFNLVEEDGYEVTGSVAALTMKARLRDLRDNEDRPMFVSSLMSSGRIQYSLDGTPVSFPKNGAMDPSRAWLISGDWSQLVYAIRQDITYKVLTEGVIQDGNGDIVYNLAQQDMSALRVVIRLGWQLPNPINLVNQNAATRYPFAFLEPQAAS